MLRRLVNWVQANIRQVKFHRFHWVFVLIGTIPALFADVFFHFSFNEGLAIRTNEILFDPILGYLYIIMLLFCVIVARGHDVKIRSITSIHLFIGALLAFSSASLHQTILSAAYLTASFISIAAFILYGRIGTQRFTAFCLVLILICATSPYLTIVRAILAIITIIVLRVSVLFVKENTQFFQQLGRKQAARIALFSALYWIPFAVAMFCSSYVTSQIQSIVEEKLYQEKLVQPCTEPSSPNGANLRADINCTVDQVSGSLKVSLDAQIRKAASDTTGAVTAFPERIRLQLENSIEREPGPLRASSCRGFLPIGCWIANAIKRSAMRAYQSARSATIDKVYSDALMYSKKANATTAETSNAITQKIPEYADSGSSVTKRAVSGAFSIYDLINVSLNALLVLAALKSFLYIYARVAYGKATNTFISSLKKRSAPNPGLISTHTNILTLSAPGTNFFFKARNEPAANFPPRISLPRPLSAVVSRVLAGRYIFDTTSASSQPITFSSPQGRTFIQWDLQADEAIIVNNFKHILLIESSCKIETHLSLKLSTLMLGSLIFPVIVGPGTVVIYTTGQAHISGNAGYNLERLLAWRGNTSFKVHVSTRILDTYFSGIQVSAQNASDTIIVDPTGSPKFFGGAFRFLRTFLVPF